MVWCLAAAWMAVVQRSERATVDDMRDIMMKEGEKKSKRNRKGSTAK